VKGANTCTIDHNVICGVGTYAQRSIERERLFPARIRRSPTHGAERQLENHWRFNG
jgi:hypothetical protein